MIKQILNDIASSLESIPGATIERMTPDLVSQFPTIRVVMGPSTNDQDSYTDDSRNLTVFTDLYLSSKSSLVEDSALDLAEQVENILIPNPYRDSGVLMVRFISQDQIEFNERESSEYAVLLRLSWQISYSADSSY